jgi:lipopolysaccharide/colanic/teichoic acid biosynthesis glycosyltransferase
MTEILRQSLSVAERRVRVEPRTVPAWWHTAKRAIDIVVALAVLILTVPIVLVALVGIFVVTGGSPIFTQQRVGRDGRTFRMYKLRTMVAGAHLLHEQMQPLSEVDGPAFKMRADPRLHALGAFLRRTSIDEIPNFINVLRGEMAAVGPRPPLPCEVADYDDYARTRLSVKPGVTCLWQISGRSTLTFDQWMALDNTYIATWSPLLDCRIILQTLPAVLRGIGAH